MPAGLQPHAPARTCSFPLFLFSLRNTAQAVKRLRGPPLFAPFCICDYCTIQAACPARGGGLCVPGKPAAKAKKRQTARRLGKKACLQKTAQTVAAAIPAHAALAEKRRDTRTRKPGDSSYSSCKSGQPRQTERHAGQKEPLRTGKICVRSFACPEGPCEPGPPKNRFAVFGRHGLFLLRIAHCAARSAAQKGAPPPFIPCKLFEKILRKNFAVWAVCGFIVSAPVPPAGSPAAPRQPGPAKTPPPPAIAPH